MGSGGERGVEFGDDEEMIYTEKKKKEKKNPITTKTKTTAYESKTKKKKPSSRARETVFRERWAAVGLLLSVGDVVGLSRMVFEAG